LATSHDHCSSVSTPFGDDGHPEVLGELEELRGDHGAVRVPVHVSDRSHVQLDEVPTGMRR
jgi:hypothetical protein